MVDSTWRRRTLCAGGGRLFGDPTTAAGKHGPGFAAAYGISLAIDRFANRVCFVCIGGVDYWRIHDVGNGQEEWRGRAGEAWPGPVCAANPGVGEAERDAFSRNCGTATSASCTHAVSSCCRGSGADSRPLSNFVLFRARGALRRGCMARIPLWTTVRGVVAEGTERLDNTDFERLCRADCAGRDLRILEVPKRARQTEVGI